MSISPVDVFLESGKVRTVDRAMLSMTILTSTVVRSAVGFLRMSRDHVRRESDEEKTGKVTLHCRGG